MLQISIGDTYDKYVLWMTKYIHYSVSVSTERKENGGTKRKLMRILVIIEFLQETSVCGHSLVQRRWDASVLKVKVSAWYALLVRVWEWIINLMWGN